MGLIGRNPADGVSLPRENRREMLFLTASQIQELADLAEAVRVGEGVLINFLGYTGLRWSEVVALRRGSIDLETGRVQIKEAATDVGGKLVFGTPKTHRLRTLVLPRSLVELLESRTRAFSSDALLFTAPKGGPLRSSNFRGKVWLPAANALAVAYPELERLRIHDLRHSAASLAISCGANVKVVQRMLGHRNASMTLDRYGHLYDEDLVALADQLDRRYQSVN